MSRKRWTSLRHDLLNENTFTAFLDAICPVILILLEKLDIDNH